MAQITNTNVFKSDPKRILKKVEEIHKYLSLRIKKFAHTWFSTKSSPSAGGGIFFCQKMHLESFRIFFWEWWFMRAQLSCNFSKIKMDWSWHYQMNNEAILVKQKNYQTCDEKQQCQEVKKSENEKKTSTKPTPTNITHPTDQGKKREKIIEFPSIVYLLKKLDFFASLSFPNFFRLT